MADGSTAWLFNRIFTMIDEHVDHPAVQTKLADEFWKLRESGGYDFSDYQIGCDEVLKHLGLARPARPDDPEYEEGIDTLVYGAWK